MGFLKNRQTGRTHIKDGDGSLCGYVGEHNQSMFVEIEIAETICKFCETTRDGVIEPPSSDCSDCSGEGVFSVVCLDHMKRTLAGEELRAIEICNGSLTVACPSCRLGRWKADQGIARFKRGMFKLGAMGEEWYGGLKSHAKRYLDKRHQEFAKWG